MLPLNLMIQASKKKEEGHSISVVADKYSHLIGEIKTEFERFEAVVNKVRPLILSCQFVISSSHLQHDLVSFFKKETSNDKIDIPQEMGVLDEMKTKAISSATQALSSVISEFNRFNNVCEQLRSVSLGLEIVRITGKIETARLTSETENLDYLIGELHKFKKELDSSIQTVGTLGEEILKDSLLLKDDFSKLTN